MSNHHQEPRESTSTDFPVVIKHGKPYVSVGVAVAIATAVASFLISKADSKAADKRLTVVETKVEAVATKADVDKLGDRMDALYSLLIEGQEARPQRLQHKGP